MIALITGTNRTPSASSVIAGYCAACLEDLGFEVGRIDLSQLNGLTVRQEQFHSKEMDDVVLTMRETILIPSAHWVFIMPEYNGSYPGILKWWIDLLSVQNRDQVFRGKRASLIGVASGRAGNIRGLEHLTGVLHYLGMLVMPDKLPVSKIDDFINKDGEIREDLKNTLRQYLDQTLQFSMQLG